MVKEILSYYTECMQCTYAETFKKNKHIMERDE